MWQDAIVSEIHQTREKISKAFGDDIHAIFAAAQRGDLAKMFDTSTKENTAQLHTPHGQQPQRVATGESGR